MVFQVVWNIQEEQENRRQGKERQITIAASMGILELIFIAPLRFLMNLVFQGAFSLLDNVGISIIVLSLVVNTALLPLYHLAEKWQNAERRLQRALAPRLTAIKEAYRGEQRHKKTVELYREFNYHPIKSLRTSFGFLIQIPFFLAAYTLLSHNSMLEGVSFLLVEDLGLPDAVFRFKGLSINVLPPIMTLLNALSSFVYAKNFGIGERIKLFAIAAVFLLLLYNSASGLVLYWATSNFYSLVKNLMQGFIRNGNG